jgi:hypothetical protein
VGLVKVMVGVDPEDDDALLVVRIDHPPDI